MRMPSVAQRKALEKACQSYQASLTLADSYLRGRGIMGSTAIKWRLGVVSSPEPGHEHAIGRLAIPYQNRLGVIAFKFRCLESHECKQHGHVKYTQLVGQSVFMFNVVATDDPGQIIHITEGELDAMVLTEALEQPVVGVPGASQWQPHWPFHFAGFSRVLVWADGDAAGRDFGNRVRKEIEAAEVLSLPAGKDVNDLYLEVGPEALKELAGLVESELEVAHV